MLYVYSISDQTVAAAGPIEFTTLGLVKNKNIIQKQNQQDKHLYNIWQNHSKPRTDISVQNSLCCQTFATLTQPRDNKIR